MERQKMHCFLMGILFLFVLIGGPSLSMAAYSGEGQQILALKSGNEGSSRDLTSQAGIKFAERMKQRTNGKIQITHYPEGQLGKFQQMLEAVKMGSMAILYNPPTSKTFYIFDLPFLFRDANHATKVLDGDIMKEFTKREFEKTGIYIYGWSYMGFRYSTFGKVPVRTPADMKGMKFRSPPHPVMIEMFKAMGAQPTPIPFGELYLALRQGVVDGAEGTIDILTNINLWEVQKYLVLTGHSFIANYAHLNGNVWQSLTPETQKVWMETWKEVAEETKTEILSKEKEQISLWKSKGATVIEPDVEAFREATKDVWKGVLTEPWEREAYEKIKATR
jgi:tripartite ATP-independent transporter DctP family solute receptor